MNSDSPERAATGGLADLPDVVDLRGLGDVELERRGMDLRRRIADNRHQVKAALEERAYQDNPAVHRRNRRAEGFAQELQVAQEALRSALEDVEREQERRRDDAFRRREERILSSTRWATWAAFAAAVAAVVAGLLAR
jgi:hypothetical protein